MPPPGKLSVVPDSADGSVHWRGGKPDAHGQDSRYDGKRSMMRLEALATPFKTSITEVTRELPVQARFEVLPEGWQRVAGADG
jgi:hypothetical protein